MLAARGTGLSSLKQTPHDTAPTGHGALTPPEPASRSRLLLLPAHVLARDAVFISIQVFHTAPLKVVARFFARLHILAILFL